MEPSFNSCTIDWRHNDASYKSFTLVYFVLGFLVPACIVVVCYRTSAVHIRAPKPTVVRKDVQEESWASEDYVTLVITTGTRSQFLNSQIPRKHGDDVSSSRPLSFLFALAVRTRRLSVSLWVGISTRHWAQ